MKTSEEKEIGLNRTGVYLVWLGLAFAVGFAAKALPVWLFALPVGVTVAGILICTRSIWSGK
ncbi:hypothetical protein [Marinobacter salarius]|uniref:hypothetical protein n=1 Tax=Marinobacter salarius TaxID=1420917 RepID=UPI0012577B2D|nr:hypothetical protein [Marinobacter salarius]VVT28151.1 conserved hypothetical protein [Marinobacter salarius]